MKRLLKIKCIYCGQKILAGDDKMGTKAHCPKCNHVIFINDSALLDKKPEEPTEGDTDLLVDKSAVERKERVDKYRAKEMQKGYFRKWFAPEFDDLSMFLMVVAAVLVLATNLNIGSNIAKFVQAISDIEPG